MDDQPKDDIRESERKRRGVRTLIFIVLPAILVLCAGVWIYNSICIDCPEPAGVNGVYRIPSDYYFQYSISKDTLVKEFTNRGIKVSEAPLGEHGSPAANNRYLLDSLTCNDLKAEACVEFVRGSAFPSLMKVIWFKAKPTKDDKVYHARVDQLYGCFGDLVKESSRPYLNDSTKAIDDK